MDRQREIYTGKLTGYKSSIPFSYSPLENAAKKELSSPVYDYVFGGAGEQLTISNNRRAFDNLKIIPKMMHGNLETDTSTVLLGHTLSYPFMLAPIGVLELMDKESDVAVAKACENEGIGMIFSNQASKPMEICAAEMAHTPKWFQLYWSKSNELVESLVQRAEKSGCSALVVTLDTTLLGWRTMDLTQAYLPFLDGLGLAQYTSDPIFMDIVRSAEVENQDQKININSIIHLLKLSKNLPGNFLSNLKTKEAIKIVQTFISIYSRPNLAWSDLAWLKSITHLPIILKGILTKSDVLKAVDSGVDGIIVSNHGGRQIDGSISSLEALIDITKNWQSPIPLLLDSGIRNGADIFKALACGSKSVLLGRPYAYALAISGQRGVEDFLKNIKADFKLTMHLSGVDSVENINSDYLK